MYEQKDIVLVPFPYSNLTFFKQRPALIISNEKINKTQDRICCLITTKANKDALLMTENSFENQSLPFRSFVKPQRIFTIHESIIIKKLCTINNKFYSKVLKKINEYIK